MDKITVGSVYSGCGGDSWGFECAGFEIVYALDNWDVACASFQANFPRTEVFCKDALEVDPSELPDVDVIIGGPPCQEFSQAKGGMFGEGEMRSFDTSHLEWFLKLIEEKRPTYWIMENVPLVRNFIKAPMINIYEMWKYGVPQLRRRLFAGYYREPEKYPTEIIFPAVLASEKKGGFVERRRRTTLGVKLSSAFRRTCLIPEAKMVQTFPLDYIVLGDLTEQYTQIGNAVPPLMAYRLARAILNPHITPLTQIAEITNMDAKEDEM